MLLADSALVSVIFVLVFIINWQYGMFFLSVCCLFFVVVEQWGFATRKTRLMKKIKIDAKQFINITGIIFYLVLFMGILVVALNTDIPLILALLLLLASRLGNNALKSFFTAQIKLRKFYS